MAYRFVRARPIFDQLSELRRRLDDGEIEQMNPFGRAMTKSMNNVRFDRESGEAVWVEEDYCSPPLAMERDVLEQYFNDIVVVKENVIESEGWNRIEDYPLLWDEIAEEV
ncbi:hypothetical protein [Haloarcula onubensis]|uniref:Uncharacterized protein n=1 Tax=Haloarcula onubensis TaxID=2950539 RepID=A0ABU2FUK7_9EURY|nr:hypothetical protein [Halomicroarcula sp. S3CR25-11]MDS0284433.1 hypothetical protein [Halomicroarcula sp. S3CR25-11]